jgi:hypothetical protein
MVTRVTSRVSRHLSSDWPTARPVGSSHRSDILGWVSRRAQPILRPNLIWWVARFDSGGCEMQDESSSDACRNRDDSTPPPVRQNAEGKDHEASQQSEFDKDRNHRLTALCLELSVTRNRRQCRPSAKSEAAPVGGFLSFRAASNPANWQIAKFSCAAKTGCNRGIPTLPDLPSARPGRE